MTKSIVLVGMMGVGKTHVGRMLSKVIGIDFFDADELIVQKAGMEIPEIFEKFGEKKFRDVEHSTILDMLKAPPCVLSCGGGAILNQKTLDAMIENSHLVWINASIDTIWNRVKGNDTRPLLKTESPYKTIERLIEERSPLYRKAHIHVSTNDDNASKCVGQIINAIKINVVKPD